ncbi:L,D-transpeptidase [Actibacterium sp. 188UL27-1]|uniref:L,D-transpeptidase n=1 Tax=Actibacterium sp. 188UL27-1 TaxID=2786961 RepID=UPI00195BD510|nr:L,D-transpeptidase [Actibacterium sp. 188UL27-1]MBM7068728.1 L,D-transpeptidase [Actibacterium sp. 188UL27-1]
MINRRMFTATALASLAAPAIVNAQAKTPFVLPEQFNPRFVRIKKGPKPGSLIVVPREHFLYFITEERKAIRYGVGVGRAGLEFKGIATIDVKKEWPTWRPTNEMIEREPRTYARFKDNDYVQPGGKGNPLGARALYLFQNGRDTYFRIHGTTQPQSIGRSVSNGCIRMINSHVIDLYKRVPIGATVRVL